VKPAGSISIGPARRLPELRWTASMASLNLSDAGAERVNQP
jgi:hypothetical protein